MVKVSVGYADGRQRKPVRGQVFQHGFRFAAHVHGNGLFAAVDKVAVGLQGAERKSGNRHKNSFALSI